MKIKKVRITGCIIVLILALFSCSDNGNSGSNSSNLPPSAFDKSVSARINHFIDVELKAIDPDNNLLTYFINKKTENGTLTQLEISKWRYTPNPDYEGLDSFTFRANDGISDSNTATIKINVSIANHPPVALNQSAQTDESISVDIILKANDADDDSLTYAIDELPLNGAVIPTINNNTWTYTPDAGFYGLDTFNFVANDGFEDSNTATISIIVGATPEPPAASGMSLNTGEDTSIDITLAGENTLNTDLTYKIRTYPAHGTLLLNGDFDGPDWTYMPDENYHGDDSFTFYVNNGYEDSEDATVSITVESINDIPSVSSFEIVMNRDIADPFEFNLNANDADNDGLTYTIIIGSGPDHGVLNRLNGSLCSYKPAADFTGLDSFQYMVTDVNGEDSNIATVTITVKPAGIIFVNLNAAGSNDGSSWSKGFKNVKDAASVSLPGDEIWVAAGTYTKSNPTDTVVLPMKDGVKIFGGFDGISYEFADRDFLNNVTILDGENTVFHVVIGAKEATVNSSPIVPVLNGFTIRNGNASGENDEIYGGGLFNGENSSVKIENCIFVNNKATDGAGIYNSENTSIEIINTTFENNIALSNGGGLYTTIFCTVSIQQCRFNNNSASFTGGGISSLSDAAVDDCRFEGNTAGVGAGFFDYTEGTTLTGSGFIDNIATDSGGGLYNNGGITVLNCNFTGNISKNGGAIFNNASGIINYTKPLITGSTFSNNNASRFGGAISNDYGNPEIVNNIFTGNNAISGGGAIYNDDSRSGISDSVFSGNTSSNSGGVIYNFDSRPAISNCSFTGNSTPGNGGVIYNDENTVLLLINSTMDGNSGNLGGALYNNDSTSKIINCLIVLNSAYNGASIYNINSAITIHNTTIADNINRKVNNNSGTDPIIDAAYFYNDGFLASINSIIWNPVPIDLVISQVYSTGSSTVNFSYSSIGIGIDPVFINGYYLGGSSTCINTGDPDTDQEILDILNGKTTNGSGVDVPGSRVDMGFHYDL